MAGARSKSRTRKPAPPGEPTAAPRKEDGGPHGAGEPVSATALSESPVAVRRYAGPAAIVVAMLAMASWTWGCWADPWIDFGRELYVPWRISSGAVLYRDVASVYGPLSSYVNAAAFTLLGVSIRTISLLNLALLGLLLGLLFRFVARIADRTVATVSGLSVVLIFGFSQYVGTGNFNFLSPYSHEATHGFILAIASLLAFAAYLKARSGPWAFVCGILLGAVYLTKPEPFVAIVPALAAGLLMGLAGPRASRGAPSKALAHVGAILGGGLVIPFAAWMLLSTAMAPGRALRGVLGSWPFLRDPALRSFSFYRWSAGTDDPAANIGTMVLAFAVLALGLLLPAAAALLLGRGRSADDARGPLIPVVGGLAAFALLTTILPASAWLMAWRAAPLFVIAVGLLLAWDWWTRREEPAHGDVRTLRVVFAIFAGFLLLKILLRARVSNFGFVLVVPTAVLVVAALLAWAPRIVAKRGGSAPVFRALMIGTLAAGTLAHLRMTAYWMGTKTVQVGQGPDRFFSDARGGYLAAALDRIEAERLPDGATMSVLPEGVMLAYLARIPSRSPYVTFLPADMIMFGEQALTRSLLDHPPDLAVIVHRDVAEFDARGFGIDFAQDVRRWLDEGYRTLATFGDPPFGGSDRFGVELRRRIGPATPAGEPGRSEGRTDREPSNLAKLAVLETGDATRRPGALLVSDTRRRESAASPPSLLLITMDTTRADHLGAYGATSGATPNLDRLAAEGALVRRAISVAPITLPAHASILTSRYPPAHGVRDNSDYRLPSSQTTLAEHLKAHGYATAAVVGSVILDHALGLAQGFDTYDDPRLASGLHKAGATGSAAPAERDGGATNTPPPKRAAPPGSTPAVPQSVRVTYQPILERKAGQVTDAAIAALRGLRPRPWFLWVHYYDPHNDYDPPPPFAARFKAPYDGEIAYMDREIGRLLDHLRRDGELDRTLVVAVADHGESLGEHGEATHGLLVYDATLRVPLIARLPGVIRARAEIRSLVSLVDIAPTVLELLGSSPLEGAQGRSFSAELRGSPAQARPPLYAESLLAARAYGWSPLSAVHDGTLALVLGAGRELYDLAADPGQMRNLATDRPGDLANLSAQLGALSGSMSAPPPEADAPMDESELERLRSLGYVAGGDARTGPPAPAASPRDPRALVGLHERILRAQAAIASGQSAEARTLLESVVAADPRNPAALGLLGTLLFSAGNRDAGIARLGEAAAIAPGVYQNQRNLANGLHVLGRLDEAEKAYRAALAIRPSSAEDLYALGNVLFAKGEHRQAIASYEAARSQRYPGAGLTAALGVAYEAAGDRAKARALLTEAVAADPSSREAWRALARVESKDGRWEQARAAFLRATALAAGDSEASFGLARACFEAGRTGEAVSLATRWLAAHPADPAAAYMQGRLLLAKGDRAGARASLVRFVAQAGSDPELTRSAKELLATIGG